MTHLVNDPQKFAADVLEGFVAAHAERVIAVPGGVVRATASPAGEVAVVLGGGSGHYPAFAGWVGGGMAHGAVCGNIFSSPSSEQAASVMRAADNGGGVIMGFGNYAGDVLHFGNAAEVLRAEGIDVRIVTVTDDIASSQEFADRRGIAGDLVVFKIAGAAAATGVDLDEVERITRRANARTRTMGVALDGCTLPGQDAPLFTVEPGTIALGLGIHGEPGLLTIPLGTAQAVADDLVDRVLAEKPEDADRVAVLVNGLGATTHEELFLVYGRVAQRFAEEGLTIVAPEVGEHVTSLDMAGLSLTVMFLDAELEGFWTAPVDTPAFRRGALAASAEGAVRRDESAVNAAAAGAGAAAVVAGSAASCEVAAQVRAIGSVIAGVLAEHEAELGALDAVAGDGDHGQGMMLGINGALRAADAALAAGAGLGGMLAAAGQEWSNSAGGTSGALWGAALVAAGSAVGDESVPDAAVVAEAVSGAVSALTKLGGAGVGDKTMIDAAVPFAEVLGAEVAGGASAAQAWGAAAVAADRAAQGTAELTARLGRARIHGDHGLGHPDPGAVSFALVVAAALGQGAEES